MVPSKRPWFQREVAGVSARPTLRAHTLSPSPPLGGAGARSRGNQTRPQTTREEIQVATRSLSAQAERIWLVLKSRRPLSRSVSFPSAARARLSRGIYQRQLLEINIGDSPLKIRRRPAPIFGPAPPFVSHCPAFADVCDRSASSRRFHGLLRSSRLARKISPASRTMLRSCCEHVEPVTFSRDCADLGFPAIFRTSPGCCARSIGDPF